jgi:hypothetical protein
MAEPFTLDLPDGRPYGDGRVMWIIDPPVDPYGDGYVRTARVEIRADGLEAHSTVTLDPAPGPWNLEEFFTGLAADWRGWTGQRRWRALEGEMTIEARHDGRAHVLLAVTIKRPQLTHAEDAWSARVVFTMEAGEQLTAVARDLASVLAE